MNTPFTIVYIWRQSRLGISEGLNVLLTDLIRGLRECGISVRILTTRRHIDGLRDVLAKNHIPSADVEIVELTRGAFFIEFKDRLIEKWKLKRESHEARSSGGLRNRLRRGVGQFLAWGLDFTAFSAPLKLLALLVAGVAAFIGLPVILCLLLARKLARRMIPALRARLRPYLKLLKGLIFSPTLFERLYRAESERVGRAIDRSSTIPAIFIPSAFEGHLCANLHKTRKLIVFPDATPLLFPTRFPGSEFSDLLLASMRDSVRFADGLICYSIFVSDMQLRRFFPQGTKDKSVTVIPQGFFVDNEFGETQSVDSRELNRFVRNYFPEYGGLPKVFFGEFEFIIYPTIDRPHKNTLTLLKAFEMLLRDRGRNIKLVLTSPGGTIETMEYIRERKLHRDVLFMPAVPIVVLNQLLERASVMVHPSLAEGGDVFNFSRAVIHGTPGLVADIPVVREMFERHDIDRSVYGEWLFEATNYAALAEKIDRIMCEDWKPFPLQREALNHLSSYGFSSMARKYNECFQSLINPVA